MDATKPHKAVLYVSVEVYELGDGNECDPNKRISEAELSEIGLKAQMIFAVDGFDKFECLKKLKAKIEPLRNK